MNLRPATIADARFVWHCRRDAQARQLSVDSRAIPWGQHYRWMLDRLTRPGFWIADGIGYARLDGDTISVGLHPTQRGRGFGSALIQAATATVGAGVIAWIRPENTASIHAFAKAGYSYAQTTVSQGVTLQQWIHPCGSPATR